MGGARSDPQGEQWKPGADIDADQQSGRAERDPLD